MTDPAEDLQIVIPEDVEVYHARKYNSGEWSVSVPDLGKILAAELERLAGEFNAASCATTEPGPYWSGIADAHNIDAGKLLKRATQLRGHLVEG